MDQKLYKSLTVSRDKSLTASGDTPKLPYLGQCDKVRCNTVGEYFWQQLMANKVEVSEDEFVGAVNVQPLLDEDESWEQFRDEGMQQDSEWSYYKSGPHYFLQTAGFEFIFGPAVVQESSASSPGRDPTTTDSQEFRRWFKKSLVVDKAGNPLVVFHGTAEEFDAFDAERAPQGIFWFTTNREKVEAGEVGAARSGTILQVYLSLQNPAGWEAYEKYSIGELIRDGYDGLALPDDDETTYVAFHTEQIKSIFNRGTWNPKKKSLVEDANDERLEAEAKIYDTAEDFIAAQDLMYHGSDTKIDRFDLGRVKKWKKFGHFFSDDEEFSKAFGHEITAAVVKLDNPRVFSQQAWWDLRGAHAKDADWFADWKKKLKADGYDGLLVKERLSKFGKWDTREPVVLVAFEDSQVTTVTQLTDIWNESHTLN